MNAERNKSYALDELRDEVFRLASQTEPLEAEPEVRLAPKASQAVYSVPCFLHAKRRGADPVKAAEEMARRWNRILGRGESLIERFEASRGYVNAYADRARLLARILKDLRDYGVEYGGYPEKAETMVVDYCSPNIAKPLSVGHLRSTIIGQALINILRARGYRVVGINFLGDWGTQFGKLVYAFERWGDEKLLEEHPVRHLLELYVRFHREAEDDPKLKEEARAAFKRLEQGGEKERALWRRFREKSLAAFARTVSRLGVRFDENWFESDFEAPAHELIERLLKQGVAEESEGAIIIREDAAGTESQRPPLLVRKSDGTTLYASRDLASAVERIDRWRPVAKLIYVVASEQKLYFTQLSNALGRMGYGDILRHISFGMVSLPSGRISTRQGRIVYLDELLDEAERRAAQIINQKNPEMPPDERAEVARQVGIGAVIYADLSQDRIKDVTFDWEKMLAFDGNSAPYLQYAAVRCAKILEKSAMPEGTWWKEAQAACIGEPESAELLMALGRFPQAVSEAAERYAPHVLAGYLYELATVFSRFYTEVPVLRSGDEERPTRLALVDATAEVLRRGLALLGIETPSQM